MRLCAGGGPGALPPAAPCVAARRRRPCGADAGRAAAAARDVGLLCPSTLQQHNERDATATASTSLVAAAHGRPRAHVVAYAESSSGSSSSWQRQAAPAAPRDVRAHVAAPVPSTHEPRLLQTAPLLQLDAVALADSSINGSKANGHHRRAAGAPSSPSSLAPSPVALASLPPSSSRRGAADAGAPHLHASGPTPPTAREHEALADATAQPQQLHHHDAQPAQQEPQPAAAAAGDRELYDEIRACETWQDVLEVVADEAPRMSLYTATQAASRLLATVRASPAGPARTAAQLQAQPAFGTLVAVLAAGVPQMSRAQLCNSLHALAQLRAPLGDALLAAYAQRAQQLAPTFNARDVAQLLHGWATLQRSPGIQVLDHVGFRAKVLLEQDQFEPQSLSMTLHSLALLEYRNHLLLRAAATVAARRMDDLTPQGVANVSWALGKLGHFSHAALEGAARAYCRAPHAYKPQEACNLLWAMTQHRYHPQEALGVVVRSLVKGAAQLRPADHAMLFRALGTFGVHPGNQLLSELLNPMGKQLARFSTVELCTVYWALGLIGESRQSVSRQIAALLPDHFEANRMNEGLLRQTFQGFLCGRLDEANQDDATSSSTSSQPHKQQHAPVSFPPLMMDAMKRAWKAGVAAASLAGGDKAAGAQHVAQDGGAGEDEGGGDDEAAEGTAVPAAAASPRAAASWEQSIKEEVASIVASFNVPHELSRPTRDGLVNIDVAVRAGEQRYVALQVVMEHEHTSNTGQFLGPLQFQARVLEMNGWEVRHVRAKDLKTLDHRSKALFLADLLRGMGVRVARSAGKAGAAGGEAGAGAAPPGVSGLDLLVGEGKGRGGDGGGGRQQRRRRAA